MELRRINRRGHRAESNLTLSDIERSFASRYLIPSPYPKTNVLTFTLGYSRLQPDTSDSETLLVGVGRTRSRKRWREALGLTFERSDFVVGVDEGVSELLIPEVSYSRTRADDRIYPRKGQRLQVKLRGAAEDLLSDSTFVRTTAEAKAIRAVGERMRVITRLEAGYIWTSDFRSLPPSIRFFAGGDQSVRGYSYQELGPLDVEGNVIGGAALLAASFEVESLFLDLGRFGRWGAAAFYDIGGSSDELGGDLEEGLGIGLRWLSPIGLVRADVALATSRPGSPVSFHLMIGPDL
jgi:translocation and assembly module TamA